MTPTVEQSAIIAAARDTCENLLINALAGAAKTTTLQMICEALQTTPILSLAFNKRIADELSKRLPPNVKCQTMNSVGHGVWSGRINRRLVVDKDKSFELLREAAKALGKRQFSVPFPETLAAIREAKIQGFIPSGFLPEIPRLISEDDFFGNLEEEPNVGLVNRVLAEGIQQGFQGKIDFDDQVYLPCLFGGKWSEFPLVCIDEAQDLSPMNHIMLQNLVKNRRVIAVGDPWQCQPPGTLVSVVRKIGNRWNERILEQVPIENLSVGDRVVGFTLDGSEYMFNYTIKEIATRAFQGNLIRVITPVGATSYTPNHRCLVNFNALRDQTALYLMKGSNKRWRVGIAKMSYEASNGPTARARAEKAEAMWILETFVNRADALIAEAAIQAAYGIPDVTFEWAGMETKGYASQEALSRVWERLNDIDFDDRARTLLISFGRDINCPLWSSEMNYLTLKRPIVTAAANILNGCQFLPFTGLKKREKKEDWVPCIIRYLPYEGPVYSLAVSHEHFYVADGFVTHNSIYAFRGADSNSMSRLRETFSMREMELSISFRCPEVIVERARFRAPHMQWAPGAAKGAVHSPLTWRASEIPDGAAIICRNNAPLFKLALFLLKNGRGVRLVGTDLGPQLIRTMRKLGDESMSQAATLRAIEGWERERLAKSKRKASLSDKADCLRVFAGFGETLGAAIAYAEHLFKQTGMVQLLSGHKAKGLEWDVVFHLDPWRIPSKWAETPEEQEQELNLRYVILTRAKREYWEVNLDDLQA